MRERRGWMRPALQQKKGKRVFFQPLIFSFFAYLSPQEFVDLSNQMYIDANAYIGRFFRTIKEETVCLQEYTSFSEAQKDIAQYIYFYNADRLHSVIGYLSSQEFHETLSLKLA